MTLPPRDEVRIIYGSAPRAETRTSEGESALGERRSDTESVAGEGSTETELPIPSGMIRSSESYIRPDEELPLHLRVLRAFLEEEGNEDRAARAFTLASEIYELELANLRTRR
jgi:hypothetical protein